MMCVRSGREKAGNRFLLRPRLLSSRHPAAEATSSARLAAALAGQYAIEREIGRGGMGIVYLARDLKLQRRVAIKTLPPHLMGDPNIRERFLREARTAGALSHQNIVPIHRADELAGHVFFVMGFVDGDSMAREPRQAGARVASMRATLARALRDASRTPWLRTLPRRDPPRRQGRGEHPDRSSFRLRAPV